MMFKDQCEAERSAGRMWSNVLTFHPQAVMFGLCFCEPVHEWLEQSRQLDK